MAHRETQSVGFPSSVPDSDMLSDGSFEKVEDVVMLTDNDIKMATA